MKKAILLLSLLFVVLQVFSQNGWQWARHIGGTGMDNATISYIDREHNVYLFGRYAIDYPAPQFNGQNCNFDQDTIFIGRNASFIAKYNENGRLIWVHNIRSVNYSDFAVVIDMQYDSLSNALFLTGMYRNSVSLAGCSLTSSNKQYYLAKIDLNGGCIWAKNLGTGCGISSMTFDQSGNIFIAGNAQTGCTVIDTSHFGGGAYIAKFNSDGSSLWAKTKVQPGSPSFTINQIKSYNNDLFAFGYVSGENNTLTIDTISKHLQCMACFGIGIFRMDSNSIAKWIRIDGLPYSVLGNRSTGMTKNGNIFCYAITSDTCLYDEDTIISQGTNFIVINYNNLGNIIGLNHLKINPNFGDPSGYGIEVLADSTYYTANGFSGTVDFGNITVTAYSPFDLVIAHFTQSGACLGLDHLGGGLGTSVAVDPSGVYLTGVFPPFPLNSGSLIVGETTLTSHGYEDIIFAKHDLLTGSEEKQTKEQNTLVIYANPNKGSFRVVIPDDLNHEKNLVLTIYDNKGRVIRREPLNLSDETPRIDIPGAIKGVYPITLSNGKTAYQGKLVVE